MLAGLKVGNSLGTDLQGQQNLPIQANLKTLFGHGVGPEKNAYRADSKGSAAIGAGFGFYHALVNGTEFCSILKGVS